VKRKTFTVFVAKFLRKICQMTEEPLTGFVQGVRFCLAVSSFKLRKFFKYFSVIEIEVLFYALCDFFCFWFSCCIFCG
jgi:hypothetical protein